MMIEITVRLETKDVEDAVGKAWAQSFARPEYRDTGGAGWQAVKRQIEDYVSTMDLTDEITRIAKARVAGVVDSVVADLLRESAKKRAKEMKNDGTLFGA